MHNENSIRQEIHQTPHRLQLLAQAIEKVESGFSEKQTQHTSSATKQLHPIPSDLLAMTSPQHQELLMKLFAEHNMATVMAAAAAAQYQTHKQQKPEPISPPSTSSGSSSVESPIDFSSHRSSDENLDGSAPSSPITNQQQQLIASMLQNLQSSSSNSSFPFMLSSKNGKPTRPFKAYPRDPLMLPLGFCSSSGTTNHSTPMEQTSLLAEAMSRSTTSRKRLAQTQERLKQRLQQQQQQQQQQQLHQQTTPPPYFTCSTGTQILQPPKKRHRTITNEDPSPIEEYSHSSSMTNNSITKSPSIESSPTTKSDDSLNNVKDEAYWERRRKNNEAAKRSRDARRAKEDEIALR